MNLLGSIEHIFFVNFILIFVQNRLILSHILDMGNLDFGLDFLA